jgi:hypothetical protein
MQDKELTMAVLTFSGMTAASMIPGVGEAMDIHTLLDHNSSTFDKVMAGISLGANVLTVGFAPNFGKTASGLDDAFEAASNLRRIENAGTSALQLSGKFRGDPFAFGTGVRDARVTSMMQDAAKASNVQLLDVVDEVRYVKGGSQFTIENGKRIIEIGSDVFERTKAGQLIEGAHEIGHAQVFDKLVKSRGFSAAEAEAFGLHRSYGTPLYAYEEELVERLARSRVRAYLGGLTPQQEAASTKYIWGTPAEQGWGVIWRQSRKTKP